MFVWLVFFSRFSMAKDDLIFHFFRNPHFMFNDKRNIKSYTVFFLLETELAEYITVTFLFLRFFNTRQLHIKTFFFNFPFAR